MSSSTTLENQKVHVLGARAGCHQPEPTTVSTKPQAPQETTSVVLFIWSPLQLLGFQRQGLWARFWDAGLTFVWIPLPECCGRMAAQIEICHSSQSWQVLCLEARPVFWTMSLSRIPLYRPTSAVCVCVLLSIDQVSPSSPDFHLTRGYQPSWVNAGSLDFYWASEWVLAPQVFLKAMISTFVPFSAYHLFSRPKLFAVLDLGFPSSLVFQDKILVATIKKALV